MKLEGAGTSSTKPDIKNREKILQQRAGNPELFRALADVHLPS